MNKNRITTTLLSTLSYLILSYLILSYIDYIKPVSGEYDVTVSDVILD